MASYLDQHFGNLAPGHSGAIHLEALETILEECGKLVQNGTISWTTHLVRTARASLGQYEDPDAERLQPTAEQLWDMVVHNVRSGFASTLSLPPAHDFHSRIVRC